MRIAQSDKYQGNDWWEWAVWIDDTPANLNMIREVTYTLHPTFRPPVHRVTDRSSKFRLETSGWGTFTIYAQVQMINGEQRELEHELQLHYPDDEKKAPALIRIANTNATLPSEAFSEQVLSLQYAILDAAPDAEVHRVKTPPAKGPDGPVPAGEALSIDLTGPAVAALARGIQSWLVRNSDAQIELVTEDGESVRSITSENIVTVLQSAMTTLRK